MLPWRFTKYHKVPVGTLLRLSPAQAAKRAHLLTRVSDGVFRVHTRPVGFFAGEVVGHDGPLGPFATPVQEDSVIEAELPEGLTPVAGDDPDLELIEAVRTITDPEHLTAKGLPKVAAVRELLGREDIKAADIERAAEKLQGAMLPDEYEAAGEHIAKVSNKLQETLESMNPSLVTDEE